MNNREIRHIVLSTDSKTKKLYFDNKPEFIKYLEETGKYFDTYPDNITIYCESTEDRREIIKQLNKIREGLSRKLYFEDVDSTTCHPLDYFIHNAKIEELNKITLLEAIPDNDNPDYIFCGFAGEVAERCDCSKKYCDQYKSKSGRGKCSLKGNLYQHGEEVTFNV